MKRYITPFILGIAVAICIAAVNVVPTGSGSGDVTAAGNNAFTGSNYFANAVFASLTVTNEYYTTNHVNGELPIASKAGQIFVTNATFTIGGYANFNPAYQNLGSLRVSNSSASTIYVTNAPYVRLIGTASTNILAIPAAKQGFWSWELGIGWSNVANTVEQ